MTIQNGAEAAASHATQLIHWRLAPDLPVRKDRSRIGQWPLVARQLLPELCVICEADTMDFRTYEE